MVIYFSLHILTKLKLSIFTKIQYFFDFCQIKIIYLELSRQKLSIGTLIVNKFLILHFGHILGKGGTLKSKNLKKVFMLYDKIWVLIESFR